MEKLAWSDCSTLKSGAPKVCFQGFVLAEGPDAVGTIDLSVLALPSVYAFLTSLYPDFPAPLLCSLLNHPVLNKIFGDEFLTHLRLRNSSQLKQLLELIVMSPAEFQAWLQQKKIGINDLGFWPGLAVTSPDTVLHFIARLNPSKSLGLQFMEKALEVLALGGSIDSILSEADFDKALAAVKKLRSPETFARDQERQSVLTWPQSVKTQWQRRGDKSGFEVSIFVSHPSELEKHLQLLDKVAKQWNS